MMTNDVLSRRRGSTRLEPDVDRVRGRRGVEVGGQVIAAEGAASCKALRRRELAMHNGAEAFR